MENKMNRRLVWEYKNDWEIDVNSCMTDYKSIQTFSPIPNVNLCFEFQTWYEVISPRDIKSSLAVFRLKLEKLYGFNLKPSLEFDIDVNVEYNLISSNSSCIYRKMSGINVEKMDRIQFDEETHKMYYGAYKSKHHEYMERNKQLVLVCKLEFYFNPSVSEICRKEISDPNTFIEDLKYFFKSEEHSDIVFNIGEQSIPAHKVILAAHSPVFKTMFLESQTNCINVTDCSYGVYEHFLRYLYFQKIEDTSYATAAELNVLSEKYNVPGLKDECARIFISYMSIENICDILNNAYHFNNDKLKIAATIFAAVHFDKLKSRNDWKTLAGCHPLIGYEVTKKVSKT